MTARFSPPSAEEVARLRALAERRLTPEEFDRYVNTPMAADELEGIRELVSWYRRRYPTVLARLQHARRAWANAAARMPRGA